MIITKILFYQITCFITKNQLKLQTKTNDNQSTYSITILKQKNKQHYHYLNLIIQNIIIANSNEEQKQISCLLFSSTNQQTNKHYGQIQQSMDNGSSWEIILFSNTLSSNHNKIYSNQYPTLKSETYNTPRVQIFISNNNKTFEQITFQFKKKCAQISKQTKKKQQSQNIRIVLHRDNLKDNQQIGLSHLLLFQHIPSSNDKSINDSLQVSKLFLSNSMSMQQKKTIPIDWKTIKSKNSKKIQLDTDNTQKQDKKQIIQQDSFFKSRNKQKKQLINVNSISQRRSIFNTKKNFQSKSKSKSKLKQKQQKQQKSKNETNLKQQSCKQKPLIRLSKALFDTSSQQQQKQQQIQQKQQLSIAKQTRSHTSKFQTNKKQYLERIQQKEQFQSYSKSKQQKSELSQDYQTQQYAQLINNILTQEQYKSMLMKLQSEISRAIFQKMSQKLKNKQITRQQFNYDYQHILLQQNQYNTQQNQEQEQELYEKIIVPVSYYTNLNHKIRRLQVQQQIKHNVPEHLRISNYFHQEKIQLKGTFVIAPGMTSAELQNITLQGNELGLIKANNLSDGCYLVVKNANTKKISEATKFKNIKIVSQQYFASCLKARYIISPSKYSI